MRSEAGLARVQAELGFPKSGDIGYGLACSRGLATSAAGWLAPEVWRHRLRVGLQETAQVHAGNRDEDEECKQTGLKMPSAADDNFAAGAAPRTLFRSVVDDGSTLAALDQHSVFRVRESNEAEFFFQIHDQLECFQRVGVDIVDQLWIGGQFDGIQLETGRDDSDRFFLQIAGTRVIKETC
ncbi:MAG: hypothetical protein WBD20_27375 [Pirellulaceae bacterium]